MERNIYKIGKELFITSDEDVKDGDWCIVGDHVSKLNTKYTSQEEIEAQFERITLTTDQDLISDGVQAIDDDFLEWFVQNPSCEFVEVIYGLYNPIGRKVSSEKISENHSQCVWKYKIIIPKEEPNPFELPKALPDDVFYQSLEKPKQETIEEAVRNHLDKNKYSSPLTYAQIGAEFQAERTYSEEEVGELVYNIIGEYGKYYGIMIDGAKLNDLFEQFKKK